MVCPFLLLSPGDDGERRGILLRLFCLSGELWFFDARGWFQDV
jgi:hypothetical protein